MENFVFINMFKALSASYVVFYVTVHYIKYFIELILQYFLQPPKDFEIVHNFYPLAL